MSRESPEVSTIIEADVAIIGAGFAGAATAFHLAHRRTGRIVLLEKEEIAGIHSSGRNAAMVRQVTPNEAIAAAARRGAAAIRRRDEEARREGRPGLFSATGSLLIASGAKAEQLEADAARGRAAGLAVECWDRETTIGRFPIIEGAGFEAACFCPSDGVVDIAALLNEYLEGAKRAGVHLLLSADVTGVIRRHGRIAGIRAGLLEVRAPVIVNAAGGWARQIGELAQAAPMPLRATRRHLFSTGPLDWVRPEWPFIWDVSAEIYFRPESGGLLLSPCDENDAAGDLDSNAIQTEALELLHRKAARQFPALGEIPVRTGWSGIRTLTPDGRFIIGPDPRLEGFFWVAGIGGHGVTASDAIGELAAEAIIRPESLAGNPHSPARFAADPVRSGRGGSPSPLQKSPS